MSYFNFCGIDYLYPPEVKDIFERGMGVLNRLLKYLSPYKSRVPLDTATLEALAQHDDCFLAVDRLHNGHIIGFARLGVSEDASGRFGILHDVIVDPDYRRLGVGQRLVDRIIAAGAGLRYIECTAKPSRPEFGQLLTCKSGFRLIALAVPHIEDSVNHFRLDLQ
jgi:GNAT superfamily N-acetyltransferase